MVEPVLFGPVDGLLAPVVEYVVLILVLINLVTRFLAHQKHARQADNGAEALQRHWLHETSNILLLLGSFYYLTVDHHSGLVLSVLVIGTILADFFEFEARNVEVRNDFPLETPKGAIVASLLATAYAAYVSLFWIIAPVWELVV